MNNDNNTKIQFSKFKAWRHVQRQSNSYHFGPESRAKSESSSDESEFNIIFAKALIVPGKLNI